MSTRIIRGKIINPYPDKIELINDGIISFDANGIIEFVGLAEEFQNLYNSIIIPEYSSNIIMPGLIDTHTHLPQYDSMGMGKGELLDWLNSYIFPLEGKFDNHEFSLAKSLQFFEALVSTGTTSAVVYTSNHRKATENAFLAAKQIGMRAFIGQSLMDCNSPDYLQISTKESLEDIDWVVKKWHKSNGGMLEYVISPRFAGCCSLELMNKSADIAKQNGLKIQTHLAENIHEIAYIKSLYPQFSNYSEIYDSCGLLTEKTILGHCIYLDDNEIKSILDNNCIISHCASSNRFLKSGVMPLKSYIDNHLKVCLGTDIGAGTSISMFDEIKEAKESSKTKSIFDNSNQEVRLEKVYSLATIDAAIALGIESETGNFQVGKSADFIVIDGNNLKDKSTYEILATLVYKNRTILETYIKGKKVFPTS